MDLPLAYLQRVVIRGWRSRKDEYWQFVHAQRQAKGLLKDPMLRKLNTY
jgi:hypothetical protein